MEDPGVLPDLQLQSRNLRIDVKLPRAELPQLVGRVDKKFAQEPLIVIAVVRAMIGLDGGSGPREPLHDMVPPECFVFIEPLVVANTIAAPPGEKEPFWSRLTLRPKCVTCRNPEPSGRTV